MKIISDILFIIRPINIVIALLSIFVVTNMISIFEIDKYFIISIVVSSYMAAGYILNDLLDIKIDSINKPHRVLVRYNISFTILVIIISGLFFIGTLFAYMLSPLSISIALYIVFPGIILYEFIFKKIALIGNIIISLLVGLVFIYTEAALLNNINTTHRIMILAFFLNLIREIIKDLEDMAGDKKYNFKTLPILLGVQPTIFILRGLSLTFLIISCIPFYSLPFIPFLPLIFFTIHLPLLYINVGLKDNISSAECAKFSKILKLIIIFGVLIILFLS